MNLDSLTLSNTAITLRAKDNAPTLVKKLSDVYEEYANLVFLFDRSGSMGELLCKDQTKKFLWPPELITEIRRQLNEAVAKRAALDADPDNAPALTEDDTQVLNLCVTNTSTWLAEIPADDEILKQQIVRYNMITRFSVPVNFAKHDAKPLSRMEVVKKIAKREIKSRLDKYPNNRVSVISFDSTTETMFDGGDADALFRALDILYPRRGTDIMTAIGVGVDLCRKHPSKVGVHHFVVVSDGEDWGSAQKIGEWVPILRQSGIVLDYIHIGDLAKNGPLADACTQLGGQFVTVSSEESLEERFVEAIKRPLLPPPADAK